MSENIFATSYKTVEEVFKTAAQIRRTCLIVQENSGYWKLLITNNRHLIEEDLSNMDLSEYDSFVHVNDSQGKILRNKVQLNIENLKYYSRIISNFSSQENVLTKDFGEIPRRFKSLITNVKQKEDKVEEKPVQEDRSGVYEIRPMDYICYFKKCRPVKTLLQQNLNNECYQSFMLQLTVKDKSSIDCVAPIIRKAKVNVKELIQLSSQGKSIQITIELKEKILEKIKYIMFNIPELEQIMNMKNPLNKPILTDLTNYVLKDVKVV
jgi:hypothetical protein